MTARPDQWAAAMPFAAASGYCLYAHELAWAAVIAGLGAAWWYVTR